MARCRLKNEREAGGIGRRTGDYIECIGLREERGSMCEMNVKKRDRKNFGKICSGREKVGKKGVGKG